MIKDKKIKETPNTLIQALFLPEKESKKVYRRKLPKIKGRKEMYVKLKLKFIFGGTRFTMHNNNSPSPFVLWLCSPFFYIFFFIFSTSISLKMGIKKEQKTTVEINLHKKQRNVVINSSFFSGIHFRWLFDSFLALVNYVEILFHMRQTTPGAGGALNRFFDSIRNCNQSKCVRRVCVRLVFVQFFLRFAICYFLFLLSWLQLMKCITLLLITSLLFLFHFTFTHLKLLRQYFPKANLIKTNRIRMHHNLVKAKKM